MPRRYYSSTAQRTTLSASASAATTTLVVNAATGFPSSVPYTLIIDQDTVSEEIVEVSARSGTTLTVTRGVDGTTATSHASGASVQHGVSARDFDDPNAHEANTTTAHGLTVANVVTLAGTQTLTNKTLTSPSLTTPTIASFANAGHNHQNSAGGGTLTVAAISDIASNYAPRAATINTQTGSSYTLVANDINSVVEMNNAGANTVTVPPSVFSAGAQILIEQKGAGQTTIAAGSGVTLTSADSSLKLRVRYSTAAIVCVASNTFLVFGDLTA